MLSSFYHVQGLQTSPFLSPPPSPPQKIDGKCFARYSAQRQLRSKPNDPPAYACIVLLTQVIILFIAKLKVRYYFPNGSRANKKIS